MRFHSARKGGAVGMEVQHALQLSEIFIAIINPQLVCGKRVLSEQWEPCCRSKKKQEKGKFRVAIPLAGCSTVKDTTMQVYISLLSSWCRRGGFNVQLRTLHQCPVQVLFYLRPGYAAQNFPFLWSQCKLWVDHPTNTRVMQIW